MSSRHGRIRARDPFELIRWLALSQPDPRKALAELVQNSLDAGAAAIRITRLREEGRPCLRILDDGEGVIPELDRPAALRYIATNIGHSRKRSLSPQDRLRLMTQGQYGIGLLGFWSLGESLEMRSAVPGHRAHRLVLFRDRPEFRVQPLRGRLPLDERWTEIVIGGLHREAMHALAGGRAADYLAAELRGQLLARDVDLRIEDRLARGTARKARSVRPPRFLGERVPGLGLLEVPGYPPIRLEVYLTGETGAAESAGGLAVYAAGTLVAEDFRHLAALNLDRLPWIDARLSGMVDFSGFQVAPGSRRGVVPDDAAGAFASALVSVEPILVAALEAFRLRQEEALDRVMIRDLQRAFRDFYRQRPRYALLPVRDRGSDSQPGEVPDGGKRGEAVEGGSDGGDPASPCATAEEDGRPAHEDTALADLLPPGPLASVRIRPARIRVAIHGGCRVHADAMDAAGRQVAAPVTFAWALEGAAGRLDPAGDAGPTVRFEAGAEPGRGAIRVTARSGSDEAGARSEVEVLEELPSRLPAEGIPEPDLVNQPGVAWRSRLVEGRWQVNIGHREYRAVADRPALKLRYLSMLFAKEVVLRSSGDPRLDDPLEQLVEVSTFADRNISGRRARRRGGSDDA